MLIKLWDLLNEKAKEELDRHIEKRYSGHCWIEPEEHIDGHVDDKFNGDDGSDGNEYLAYIKHDGKFWEVEYATYALAGFTSWGRALGGSNRENYEVELTEVKQVEKTIKVWVRA